MLPPQLGTATGMGITRSTPMATSGMYWDVLHSTLGCSFSEAKKATQGVKAFGREPRCNTEEER